MSVEANRDPMASLIFWRGLIVRAFQLSPFVIGFIAVGHPFNLAFVCLLIIKLKSDLGTAIFEIETVLKLLVAHISFRDDAAAHDEFEKIKVAFSLGDEVIRSFDVDYGKEKIWSDLLSSAVEWMTVFVLTLVAVLQYIGAR